nr:glycosyltransferase [Litchfieldia alkalitelluris]
METLHVIVATGEWNGDQLRYRRHRLAEFLLKQKDTIEVIWLCPSPSPGHKKEAYITLPNGIKQWTIADFLPQKPFRIGRYIDIMYKEKLNPLIDYLKKFENIKVQLWYTFPGFPILSSLFRFDKVIYDCSDLWAAPMNGGSSIVSKLREKIILQAEERLIHKAGTVFCTSDYLRNKIETKVGSSERIHTFENGVDFELFENKQKELPYDFKTPVIGFIGGIKPKLDFDLIKQVAKQRQEWTFLFVGPDGTNGLQEFKELLNEKNVVWTGSVDPLEVPKYMELVDIGIMPYKHSIYNEAVFPLKLFEFLAAGKPVVGAHLPSTKKYQEKFVYSYLENNNVGDFVSECEELLKMKNCQNHINRRKELAYTKNWDHIFQEMIQTSQ